MEIEAADARRRPTRDEIATDWELWTEYVDPAGVMTHEDWLAMTPAERVAMQDEHASHALERGASVALVRDTLGHASIATTSKYLHAKPTDRSEASNE